MDTIQVLRSTKAQTLAPAVTAGVGGTLLRAPDPDAALVRRVVAGELVAFEQLFRLDESDGCAGGIRRRRDDLGGNGVGADVLCVGGEGEEKEREEGESLSPRMGYAGWGGSGACPGIAVPAAG